MDGVEIVEKESADARRGRATDLAGEGSRGVDSIDTIRWRPGAAIDPVLMPTGAGGDASYAASNDDVPIEFCGGTHLATEVDVPR